MNLLIVGCGYVGSALATRCQALMPDATGIYGLRRNVGALPKRVLPIAMDLHAGTGPAPLPDVVFDQVFFCAAPDTADEAGYRRTYVDGTRSVLQALSLRRQCPRVVFVSSTAVYGQNDGSWVDETSPTQPPNYRGRVMLEAEALVARLAPNSCSVRFGGIYGPGRMALLEAVRAERLAMPSAPHYTNRIHLEDGAGVLAHLAVLPNPSAVYIGCDSEPADKRDIIRFLCARLGKAVPACGEDAKTPCGKRTRNARLVGAGYAFAYPTYREGFG